MEYIDSQVDINDDDLSQSSIHIGQHIHAQFDAPMPIMRPDPPTSKINRRESERLPLSRQASDVSIHRLFDNLNRTTTELKGRDHVRRAMKTTDSRPNMELKNHKVLHEMLAKRSEQQATNRPISDFALNYGLADANGKQSKRQKSSEFMYVSFCLFTSRSHHRLFAVPTWLISWKA